MGRDILYDAQLGSFLCGLARLGPYGWQMARRWRRGALTDEAGQLPENIVARNPVPEEVAPPAEPVAAREPTSYQRLLREILETPLEDLASI